MTNYCFVGVLDLKGSMFEAQIDQLYIYNDMWSALHLSVVLEMLPCLTDKVSTKLKHCIALYLSGHRRII